MNAFRIGAGLETARDICAVMALVMALASLPAVGIVFVREAGTPCITLNICHPLQSAFPASGNVPLARSGALAGEFRRVVYSAASPRANPPTSRFLARPDPPPPKISA